MTQTENYNLPQFENSDVFKPTELNSAFETIDNTMKENSAGFGVVKQVEDLETEVADIKTELEAHLNDIAALQTKVQALESRTYSMFGDGTVKYVEPETES